MSLNVSNQYLNTMKNHYDISDTEFEVAFGHCTVPPDVFNHEAHLRLAWIHISKYGVARAEMNIQEQLEAYVDYVGGKDKYNITLTIAAVRVVNHFIRRSTSHTFGDFIAEFPELKFDFKRLIGSHYSFDVFNSQKAKIEYLEPDLLPF